MIIRIHHCLADGISGVGIMNVLLDASPTPQKLPRKKTHAEEPCAPTDSVAILLLDRFLKSYQSFMQGALTAQTEVLNIAGSYLRAPPMDRPRQMIHLVPELATPSERLPFNKVCRGPQQLAWGEIPMAEIKAIRTNLGGTVNDVVLSVVTSAVRRYSELHGVNAQGKAGETHRADQHSREMEMLANWAIESRSCRSMFRSMFAIRASCSAG